MRVPSWNGFVPEAETGWLEFNQQPEQTALVP